MHGTVLGDLPPGGPEGRAQAGAPTQALAGGPEPKLTGEASLGPVDSQAWASQGTAGWRKGTPAPELCGGPAQAPEPELAGEASPGLGPSGYGRLEEVITRPWARRGPGAQPGLSEQSHAGEVSLDPVPGSLPHGGLEDEA
ncbi:hypothetical protein NDU88_004943 [Pleurodeles waltl]|uniref:Androgen receptor n=1 Tax=Pleurodeles waltl TaxID=8319 RepID=A0AAV7PGM6_PLEWA|nr:hypothetical protein NDU88_004943 [Pleurodeles waltl]